MVSEDWGVVPDGCAAAARGDLGRKASPDVCRADCEAAPGRPPQFVRLAGHRPDRAKQSHRLCPGPSHSARQGKTPVLDAQEARQLLDSIDVSTPIGLRDRALIGVMVFSFARIGAALAMRGEDVYTQHRRLWVRLHEKGGKRHEMPCHHRLEEYLHAYLTETGIHDDPKGPLFRTIRRGTGQLSNNALPQANAHAMVRRRAMVAGIETPIGNHTFRATGITAYLKNGGTLENAASMANHASTRTTQIYDRRRDDISLDEVERIQL